MQKPSPEPQIGSRTISRVLYHSALAGGMATVIPLGAQLPVPSSNLPGNHRSGRSVSLLGLASNGACLACRVATAAGGLLHHPFTLTVMKTAVCSLLRLPKITLPGCYPAFRPVKPGLSSPRGYAQRRPVRLPKHETPAASAARRMIPLSYAPSSSKKCCAGLGSGLLTGSVKC